MGKCASFTGNNDKEEYTHTFWGHTIYIVHLIQSFAHSGVLLVSYTLASYIKAAHGNTYSGHF